MDAFGRQFSQPSCMAGGVNDSYFENHVSLLSDRFNYKPSYKPCNLL